ncbi:hypothetical protein NADRNF5_0926 [Nitrosopumilus adriaticus]|uniref:Uncharacterized protein n=1 Tax=Nitrosopumilus adriaticus TaxID=1580092 RepID=A0A0D5C2Q3_9ARCH|nr:hypothetical protein NADRNF5_0926 [Nitrosopumilus adriaticus]
MPRGGSKIKVVIFTKNSPDQAQIHVWFIWILHTSPSAYVTQ